MKASTDGTIALLKTSVLYHSLYKLKILRYRRRLLDWDRDAESLRRHAGVQQR
jgi:hypothetical protein